MLTVLGIDPSLTGTGYSDGVNFAHTFKPQCRGHERLRHLEIRTQQYIDLVKPNLVVIEGPSYGSKSSTYHQLAGGWWIVAHTVWKTGVPYTVVTPQQRAIYATGRGNASKDAVLASTITRWFGICEFTDNNCADAWVIAMMGRQRYAPSTVIDLPSRHKRVISDIEWTPPIRQAEIHAELGKRLLVGPLSEIPIWADSGKLSGLVGHGR